MMYRTLISSLAFAATIMATAPSTAGPDCHAIGEQVAAEHGGKLARAVPAERDGQKVCVVVVLEAGQQGERPRRTEIIVPAE
ncbi:MAG: hypothetical protein IPL47_16025 [Phyllobacteriaceae bacterium]|nr:hypothetical protein [Phyllobacteriaceae bacterium]